MLRQPGSPTASRASVHRKLAVVAACFFIAGYLCASTVTMLFDVHATAADVTLKTQRLSGGLRHLGSHVRQHVSSSLRVSETNQSATRATDLPPPSAKTLAAEAASAVSPNARLPWHQPLKEVKLCTDTCEHARNGKCEDGTQPGLALVLCNLGEDCADCGPWMATAPAGAEPRGLNSTAMLKEKGIPVLVSMTKTHPGFVFAHTNPAFDVDVSRQASALGVVEARETLLMAQLLNNGCNADEPDLAKRGLVVDVGGNFGWHAVWAAKLGCRVITFEPVPQFRAFLELNVLLNNVSSLVSVRPTVVADEHGAMFEMAIPQRGIWGTAGIGGFNIDKGIDNEGPIQQLSVLGERLDRVIGEDMALMKMDVEGFETHVWRSAQALLAKHRIDHVLFEYSTGVWERAAEFAIWKQHPQMLMDMLDQQYRLRLLGALGGDAASQSEYASSQVTSSFMEITRLNVLVEMEDGEKLSNGTLGCSEFPAEILEIIKWRCIFPPEAFHPWSAHAHFGHNTNIWAARRDVDTAPVGRPVGLHSLDHGRQFFTDTDHGPGGRTCATIDPRYQLAHRCPCTDEQVCGEQQRLLVDALQRHGIAVGPTHPVMT